MYSIYDYAYNGLLYLNNMARPRHKRLSQLMIYSTTACQSRCKHCNIWQKRPVEHLSFEDIQRIMQSRCVTRRTTVATIWLTRRTTKSILKAISMKSPISSMP